MASSAFPSTGTLANKWLVRQSVTSTSNAASSSTAIIPLATIPQITDGAQLITVTITPEHALNELVIDFYCPVAGPGGVGATVFILCKNGVSACLNACSLATTGTNVDPVRLYYRMTAGTTSPVTFQIRFGTNSGGSSAHVLQSSSGSYNFGGGLHYYLNVTEIGPNP